MAERVTQVSRRSLVLPNDANARVTQVSRRTLMLPNDANARVTQVSRRVLVSNYANPASRQDVVMVI